MTSTGWLEKWVIFQPCKMSRISGYAIVLILFTKSIRDVNVPLANFFYPYLSDDRMFIGMCRSQVLILEYFYANCISLIYFKYLD